MELLSYRNFEALVNSGGEANIIMEEGIVK